MNANTQILRIITNLENLIESLKSDYARNAKKIAELKAAIEALQESIR